MKDKREKLIKQLQDHKLDALLLTNASNVEYVSNFTGSNKTLLITKKKTYLFTDARYTLRAKEEVPKNSGITIIIPDRRRDLISYITKHKKIGFEAETMTVSRLNAFKKICKGCKFIPTKNIVENIRVIKGDEEIHHIKKSCQILDRVYKALVKEIKVGKREQDLAWRVRELAFKEGAEDIAFDPIIAFGKNSALPHHKSNGTKLKKNDVILIDIGVKYKGYCSDMSRVILPKNPSTALINMYHACLEAKESAAKSIVEGIQAKDADLEARKILKKYKMDKLFTHSLGHGLGRDIHENPSLSPMSPDTFKEGSVFTIEPGVYKDNFAGIRLEDTYLLKSGKAIPLTKTPIKHYR